MKPKAKSKLSARRGSPSARGSKAAKTARPRPSAANSPARKRDELDSDASSSDHAGSSVPFPIVGVGASAGGLEAFKQLLENLGNHTGMAFVLVQHLDPAHVSALTQLLSRVTALPVCEVTNGVRVQPNRVYVIPPNTCMCINKGVLKLRPRADQGGVLHHSIDYFFEALAEDQRGRAIGVVLSGTASDGTNGLEAIKAEGGITFAQDGSAKYDSMPRNAIGSGCVDFVLSPEGIARELSRIAKHPLVAGKTVEATASSSRFGRGPAFAREDDGRRSLVKKSAYEKILALLRNHSGVDFSLYKHSTIERRINRRIVVHKLASIDAYAEFLRDNPAALDALYADVLINVTSFFRNPEAFEILKRKVFPKLLPEGRDEPIRMWVPGCSTGQEAYSLAMAFTEFCDGAAGCPKLQIFATDLSETILNRARGGLYPKTLVHDVSPERLRRFFVPAEGGYRICKPLRDMVVFARQNLLCDPPFSRMHLISCRNLLIYIEPILQKTILPVFHYALRSTGHLFLGASEGIGGFASLFETVDRNYRIYSKKPVPTPAIHLHFAGRPPQARPAAPAPRPPGVPERFDPELSVQREADRLSIKRHSPPGLLVNGDLQVLQFRGDTSPYLKTPAGRPTVELSKMAREGLLLPLRAAFNKARKENKMVRTENVRVIHNGQPRRITIEISPLKNLKAPCYLIFFEIARRSPKEPKAARPPQASSSLSALPSVKISAITYARISDLESELAEKDDYLQSVQEQYEAANEDLQAFGEEITSANEELQSTNEELETSKEELESNNEELTTVNDEMASRNLELGRLNSDLQNLQATLNMPVMVLGRDLAIRSFTPLAEALFNLLSSDVGRPLSSVRHNLELTDLDEFITGVIQTTIGREREVQDKTGHWYSLRVRPYLTVDHKVDGAVLVLVDIDALKKTTREIAEARDYAEAVIRTAPNPLIILEGDLRVHKANAAFYTTFRISPTEAEGRLIYELGNGQWNIPKLRELLEEILPQNNFFDDLEISHDFQDIGPRTMVLNARTLTFLSGQPARILLGIQDITTRKAAEEALRQTQRVLANHAAALEETIQLRTARLRETIGDLEHFSYTITHDMRAPLRAMKGYADLVLGHSGNTLCAESATHLKRIVDASLRMDALIQDALQYGKILTGEIDLLPVEPVALIRGLVESYPTFQSPLMEIEIVEPLPCVIANRACLHQCFSNLLANSLKFVELGKIPRVRIWAEVIKASERSSIPNTTTLPSSDALTLHAPDAAATPQVRLWFEDNGIGIAPEYQHSIFDMFQQLDRTYDGTGIGLALVRKSADRMGGTVGVESEPGKGSRFWLQLDAAPVSHNPFKHQSS